MKTRTGKIARLPKSIREQLNQRLENGELGTSLVQWLNQLPEVQKIITEQFAGLPIRPQNLSEWRKGGYVEWTRHQLLREQTRWVSEQSAELCSDSGPRTITIAEDVATILSAELALHVQALGAITDPKKRFQQFRLLCRELSHLRRDDQRAIRTNHRREQWRYDHPQKPEPPTPKPEPAADEVRSPKPYIPSIEDLKRLRAAAYLRQMAAANTPEASEPRAPVRHSLGGGGPVRHSLGGGGSVPECDNSLSTVPSTIASATVEASAKADLPLSETKAENNPATPDPTPQTVDNPKPDSSTISEQAPYNPPLPPPPSTLYPLSSNSPKPSAPIRPNPSQNNSSDCRPPVLAEPTPPRKFTSPHRDYYDPRPPIRGRRLRCLEG